MIVKPVDIEGSAIYAVELALWIGIMWLGIIYNLREWIRNKRGLPSGADGGDQHATVEMEGYDTRGNDIPLQRTPTNSSASSVFQTVGLRKRATKLLRLTRSPNVCTHAE